MSKSGQLSPPGAEGVDLLCRGAGVLHQVVALAS